MVTAVVILLLLTLCGFIAYMGDLLGRRLGKKRLSVFGLRPKHTAILLTIVTGVLIAGVTFGAALITVPNFRQAVVHSERLMQQNRELARDNTSKQADNTRLANVNSKLVGENKHLAGENQRLGSDNQKLTAANQTLDEANRKLQEESKKLAAQNAQLQASKAELLAGNQSLRKENGRLASERDRLSVETTAFRQGEYVFRKDELVAQRPFPPNPPSSEISDQFTNLLLDAEAEAKKRKLSPRKGKSAVVLVPPHGSGLKVADTASVRAWLIRRTAHLRNQPLVIWGVVDKNCVRGQSLQVRVECFANVIVFRKGEDVAQGQLDGADTPGIILMKFISFLQSTVRAEATRTPRSMIPVNEGIGYVDPDAALAICNRIRDVGGPAVIYARARTNTLRSGPLNLEFEVRPLSAALPKRTDGGFRGQNRVDNW